MQKQLLLALFALALLSSGCVHIPNTTACTAAGALAAGAICSETLTGKTSEMTLEQFIEFLEPQVETPTTPARAGAVCQSASDYNLQKTALEQACRELGSRCSYEIRAVIRGMK